MEENSLTNKIQRESQYIKQEIAKFRRSFEAREVDHSNLTPYLESVGSLCEINSSFVEDYYEFISKKQVDFVLCNNRLLVKDVSAKLKSVASFVSAQDSKEKREDSSGTCKICSMQIEERNIQDAKVEVNEGVGFNSLRKMMQKFEEENNMALFDPDEDRNFFKQLNRVLLKKQEVLSITDNHLENYLNDIMDNLKNIKEMDDLKDTSFVMPNSINWDSKIKEEINAYLLSSFKGKVPDWIQKTFDQFIKIHHQLTRKIKEFKGCQTDEYVPEQIPQLEAELEQLKEALKQEQEANQKSFIEMSHLREAKKLLQIEKKILMDKLFDKSVEQQKSSMHKPSRNSVNSTLTSESAFLKAKKSKNQNQNASMELNTSVLEEHSSDEDEQILRQEASLTENADLSKLKMRKKKKKKTAFHSASLAIDRQEMVKENKENFLPSIHKSGNQQISRSDRKNSKRSILDATSSKKGSSGFARKESAHLMKGDEGNSDQKGQNKGRLSSSNNTEIIRQYKDTLSEVKEQMIQKSSHLHILKKNSGENRKQSMHSLHNNRTLDLKKLEKRQSAIVSNGVEFNPIKFLGNRKGEQFNIPQSYRGSSIAGEEIESEQTSQCHIQTKNGKQNIHRELKDQYLSQLSSGVKSKVQSEQRPSKVTKNIEVQTEESQISFLKEIQNSSILQNIDKDHLKRIFTKIFVKKAHVENQSSIIKRNNIEQRKTSKGKLSDHKSKTEIMRKNKKLTNSTEKANTLKQGDAITNQINEKNSSIEQTEFPSDKKGAEMSTAKKELIEIEKLKTIHSEESDQQQTESKPLKQKSHRTEGQIDQLQIGLKLDQQIRKVDAFTRKDFALFGSQENCCKYEGNLKQKYHKSPSVVLTTEQRAYFTSVYQMISLIKQHSPEAHLQIVSFLKYPFQTVVNGFSVMNVVKEMSLSSFLEFISRIKYFHMKCPENEAENRFICHHIEKFVQKIEDIAAEYTYSSQFFNEFDLKKINSKQPSNEQKMVDQSAVESISTEDKDRNNVSKQSGIDSHA